MSKYLQKISWFFLFLGAFVLGIKQIHEPDLWWMFRTGHWMVENNQIPTTDVFSFTNKGTDWISVKWLFELIAYGFASLMGPESIGVLQGIVNVLLLIFFLKTVKNLSTSLFDFNASNAKPWLIVAAIFFLFSSDFRLTERPEMFSYLFTMMYLYLFTRYKNEPGNYIYWLIPIQILWVNLHEAFAVGLVMLTAFGVGELFDFIISKKGDKKNVNRLLLASALAIFAVAVNPRGFYMFYHPYFLFMVVESNHYTTELNSLFYKPEYYLSFKEPYLALTTFFIATGAILNGGILTSNKKHLFSKISSGYFVTAAAFMYLGITGYRNVIFPLLILTPIAFSGIIYWVKKLEDYKWYPSISSVLYVLPVLFYLSIVTNLYYDTFSANNRFGLATLAESNPAGAAKFVQDHQLSNERTFSDYLSSSYFLWELRPGFESYIDLRDLDIFEKAFFEEFARITYFTNYFEKSDSIYGYNQVMLTSANFPNLHKYLYHSPNWVHVYADPVATVYLKNNSKNQHLIKEFGPDTVHLESNFTPVFQPEPSTFSSVFTKMLWPFFEFGDNSEQFHIKASTYFRSLAEYDRAEYQAQQAIEKGNAYAGWIELGNIYLEIVPYMPSSESQNKYVQMANNAFTEAVKINKENGAAYMGLGQCAYFTQEYGYALKQFKKATKANPENALGFIKIADCYAMLYQKNQNNSKNADLWLENMTMAYQLDSYNQTIIAKLAIAYCQRNQCDMASEYLKKYNRTPEVTKADHEAILKCRKSCN